MGGWVEMMDELVHLTISISDGSLNTELPPLLLLGALRNRASITSKGAMVEIKDLPHI